MNIDKKKLGAETRLVWETREHKCPAEKINHIWSMGIVGLAISIGAFLLENYLLSILMLVATFALIIKTVSGPKTIKIKITDSGIVLENKLFPFDNVESFFITEDEDRKLLLIHLKSWVSPVIQIPLIDTNIETVREILNDFVPEISRHKSITDRAVKWLGF